MSEYGYDDPPRRRRSQKVRDYDYDREPEYVTETTYIQRGPGQPSRELVYRGRDDDVESIDRDFPPPRGSRRSDYDYDRGPRRTRSVGRRDYDDDYYSEYGAPAAGAAAGAAAGYAASRAHRGSRYDDGYYSDDYDRPRHKERRKSTIESALEGFGLGGIAGALTGKSERSRSRSRRRDYDDGDSDRSTRSRRRDRSQDTKKKWQQAATAAVIAGAVEAYRGRKDQNKGTRIATAALASAGLDSFLDRNPDEHKKRHVVESVIGGLAANRLANGPRERSRGRDRSPDGQGFMARSRSRLRSLSRGRGRDVSGSRSPNGRSGGGGGGGSGLKDIAAIGGVAAVGKAIYDRVRSKSRGRNRSRSISEDSYVPSRRQRYQADRGRGTTGGDRDGQDGTSDRGRSQHNGSVDDRGIGAGWGGKKRDDSTDSVSTTDLENQRKKSRGKELLTAGFAAVATIHAAHGVYSSMKASEERHKAVQSGEITKEQARKQKSKNMLQDAAAVGIAALGIKGAFSEWKEMNETRHEVKELEDKRRRKRKRREQRRREQRELQMQMGFPTPYGPYAAAPMPAYGDANPYAVGNLPPPPMGGPARY